MTNAPKDVSTAILRAAAAVVTFSNPSRRHMDWTPQLVEKYGAPLMPRKIVVRVANTSNVLTRVESFTDRQSFTKGFNFTEDLPTHFHELMQEIWLLGFRQVLVQLPDSDFHILRTAHDDRYTIKSRPPTRSEWEHVVSDRARPTLLDPEQDSALLYALDIATANGMILSAMSDKYKQLNHLLGIALQVLSPITDAGKPVNIIDAGCGKAYLSLALYYVLSKKGIPCSLLGVDTNNHVIHHANKVSSDLGFSNATFHQCSIADVPDAHPCSLLVALHACNTASDDALFLGIRTKTQAMLVAPCCHNYVQKQLTRSNSNYHVAPLLEDGIIKERLGDLLTDVMRSELLKSEGYDVTLMEFISLEHTQKNVLIKAERAGTRNSEKYFQEFEKLREFWGVEPFLASLLHESKIY